jgi:hypothetical protein
MCLRADPPKPRVMCEVLVFPPYPAPWFLLLCLEVLVVCLEDSRLGLCQPMGALLGAVWSARLSL